jgi:CRISPR-associated protein Cmr1
MKELKVRFRIVTPLFMSGLDRFEAELRAPSIKGVLRFWWRAMALGRLVSVDKVREDETRIFGSGGDGVGQAKVHFRLNLPKELDQYKDQILKYADGQPVGPGVRYLGYGVIKAVPSKKRNTKQGQLLRSCLKYPFDGVLNILIKNSTSKADVDSVVLAIISMGLFGGLGSRSRKGFGSFNILDLRLEDELLYKMPKDAAELKSRISSFFEDYSLNAYRGLPPYTAFSDNTRIDIIENGSDPLYLLNSIGEAMQMYRSWGRNGMVNGKPSERNFKNDHDLALAAINSKVATHPLRVVFGLPHNYYFSSHQARVDVKPQKLERRASPQFLHIQELGDGQFVAVSAIIPAKFLPSGEGIRVGSWVVPQNISYKVLDDFLDGKNGLGMPRFPNAVRVI